MNGTNWTSDHINNTPAAQKKHHTYLNKVKVISCILFSNILLYLLLTLTQSNNASVSQKQNHILSGHELIDLPVISYVPILNKEEKVAISLYDANLNLIVPKAFLHPRAIFDNEFKRTEQQEQIYQRELVEVPIAYILKLIKLKGIPLFAYPYTQESTNIKKIPKEASYEIIF